MFEWSAYKFAAPTSGLFSYTFKFPGTLSLTCSILINSSWTNVSMLKALYLSIDILYDIGRYAVLGFFIPGTIRL